MSLRLGVLVSGGGTNLQAILDAIERGTLSASCNVVVSNRPSAFALERAKRSGVPTATMNHKEYASREAFDEALVEKLRSHGVEWVALAGFMRVLTPVFLSAFQGRIINIHPSLLPAFPGIDAQTQAFAYGVKVAGCTVHFVDGGVDTGPIILQRSVPVLAGDTADSLKERILVEEHIAFVEGLNLIANGLVRLEPGDGEKRARVVISERGKS